MAKLQVQVYSKIPNEYVIIERSRSLSLLEEKLVYMLINSMQKRYEEIKLLNNIDYNYIVTDTITFDSFIKTMKLGSDNRKEIGNALRGLTLFALAIVNHTSDRFLTMFSEFYVDYKAYTITYKFNDSFARYFTGVCRDYFKLSIEEVVSLNSTYAIRIYQLLKTKQNMDKKMFSFSLIDLKKLLNIDTKYNLYSNFKRKVLEVAKDQINSSLVSSFNIEYKEFKTGKAVTSIIFTLLPKTKNYYVENNKIPTYKINQITDKLPGLLQSKNNLVKILAEKIQRELSQKKPSMAAVRAYLDALNSTLAQ